jgi:hypothetical protein
LTALLSFSKSLECFLEQIAHVSQMVAHDEPLRAS